MWGYITLTHLHVYAEDHQPWTWVLEIDISERRDEGEWVDLMEIAWPERHTGNAGRCRSRMPGSIKTGGVSALAFETYASNDL